MYHTTTGRNYITGVIDHTTQPDYDRWGPDTFWSCGDWIAYYYALKKHYGKGQGAAMFRAAWEKQDIFEHAYNFCRFTQEFNNFAKKEDLQWLTSWISRAAGGAQNTADGVINTAGTISKLLPLILLAGVFVLFSGPITTATKNYKNAWK